MKVPLRIAAALLIVAGVAHSAGAQGASRKYGELLKRIPEKGNVMLLVDVDGLLNSPLGQREKWREKAEDRPTGALGVSTDAAKFVVGAGVDLQSAEEHWKIGMLQAHANPPALNVLAGREGGYVEHLQTQNVAWSPRDFYLFSFPERIVGFAVPADRQVMSEWIKTTLTRPRAFPPGWADRAISRADAGSQIVLAVNLAQAIAPKQAEVWLSNSPGEAIKKKKVSFNLFASKLAGAKLAYLQVDVKETIQGTVLIEFESPVEVLKPVAKELVLASLEDFGAEIEDLKSWGVEVKDTTITMTGRLSEESVRRILSFVTAPTLSLTPDSTGDAPPNPNEAEKGQSPEELALKVSRRYYNAVSDIIGSLKGHVSASPQGLSLWIGRLAKQVEDLPLLNVDTDLLEWGSKVALTLREMSSGISRSSRDQSYRIAGTAQGNYGGYGYGGGTSRTVDSAVIMKQSNAIMKSEIERLTQVLESSISDIRRKMVAKYKVEF